MKEYVRMHWTINSLFFLTFNYPSIFKYQSIKYRSDYINKQIKLLAYLVLHVINLILVIFQFISSKFIVKKKIKIFFNLLSSINNIIICK